GLSAALGNLVHGWTERFRVPAQYYAFGVDRLRLLPEAEINLYRLVQEALHNIYKHAQAAHVSVMFERPGDEVVLIVEDDGDGFDLEAVHASEDGTRMGLISMRERAALAGGELEIESSMGGGTTILV